VAALIHTADDYGYDAQLLKSATEVNQQQRMVVLEKLQRALKILKGKTIGLMGLTFKPDTDDLRDAPALDLIKQLNRLGAKVKAYDPLVSQSGIRYGLPDVSIETNPEQLAEHCHALVLVTDWQEFKSLDYGKLATLMHSAILIDGRNCLERKVLEEAGFKYLGVGC